MFTLEGNDGGDNTVGNNESAEEANRVAERPKLNLKPRSQPTEAGAELIGSENLRYGPSVPLCLNYSRSGLILAFYNNNFCSIISSTYLASCLVSFLKILQMF